jgi:hypothetical protein
MHGWDAGIADLEFRRGVMTQGKFYWADVTIDMRHVYDVDPTSVVLHIPGPDGRHHDAVLGRHSHRRGGSRTRGFIWAAWQAPAV